MNMTSAQILVSVHHFPLKWTRSLWISSQFQGYKGQNKMSLDYPRPESKEALKEWWEWVKKTQKPTWNGLPLAKLVTFWASKYTTIAMDYNHCIKQNHESIQIQINIWIRSKSDKEWNIFTEFKAPLQKILTNFKEERSNFTVKKSGRNHLHQVKWPKCGDSNGTKWQCVPPDRMQQTEGDWRDMKTKCNMWVCTGSFC